MQNFIQSGKTLTLVAPSGGVRSGEFVQVGSLHGFAITDAAEGVPVSVSREGVYSAPKAGVEIHQGNKLYFDAFNKVFTTSVTGVNLAVATEDAASGDPTCALVLLPETEAASGGGGGGAPAPHAASHHTGGTDALAAADIGAAAATHASRHHPAGADPLTYSDLGACSDTDSRLTDARTPTAHAGSHASGQPDAVTPSAIGAPALAHGHSGTSDGSALAQAHTHESADTDSGTGSLHHTLGTGATQAAAGDHGHATLPGSDEKAALAGTNGTPSGTNKYVTDSDPRLGGGGGGGGPAMVDVTVALGESTATTAPAPGQVGWTALGVLPVGADVSVANVVVNVDGSVTLTTLAASTAGSAFKVCLFNPGS